MPKEPTMIRYFWEGPKPYIQVKIEQCSCKLDSFKDTIKKTVDIKVKAAFWPCFIDYEID